MEEAADDRRMGQLLLLNQTVQTNKTSNKALRHAARVTTRREREVQLCSAPKNWKSTQPNGNESINIDR